MKRIFIFPTIAEAKAFILTEPRDPVFVAGVGMAEIAAATVRAVKARKPQLVVLAGIAGACGRALRRGEVVEVVTERVAGLPARFAREYETSGPDLGLPLAAGVTVSRSGEGVPERAQDEPPGTVNESESAQEPPGTRTESEQKQAGANAGPESIPEQPAVGAGAEDSATCRIPHAAPLHEPEEKAAGPDEPAPDSAEEALPEVENMEGAAFFAVCEALGVACCQIRAVSNYVGEPFGEWAVDEAVENLTATLTQLFGNDE